MICCSRRQRGPVVGAVVTVLVALAIGAPVFAEPAAGKLVAPVGTLTIDGALGRRVAVDTPKSAYARPDATVSRVLFLNRCVGGCAVHLGTNDAQTDSSSIPIPPLSNNTQTEFTVGEFGTPVNGVVTTGSAADADWMAVVQCMKEVYSPYNVSITETRPTSGTYNETIIAGVPQDIGETSDVLGVAPLASDCSAIDDVVSFVFANHHPTHDRALQICWTAAQESAHAYGLDHEYSFADDSSACDDPMTYRTDCGGEKFFRNEFANCGEFAVRTCKCGSLQNSHLRILGVFGPGQTLIAPPTMSLISPAATDTMLGSLVSASSGSQRGVAKVEFYFNGFQWTDPVKGEAFGAEGQPDPFTYTLRVPDALPDSIVDVQAIAYDDIGAATKSDIVTVTKGAPCTSASTCATGQKCTAGKCFWDPPTGKIGDACTYAQFCTSGICTGTAQQQICTQNCDVGADGVCPSGMSCVAQSDTQGVCFFSDGGGCCSTTGGGSAWWAHAGFAALVLGIATRRRRRLRSLPASDDDSV